MERRKAPRRPRRFGLIAVLGDFCQQPNGGIEKATPGQNEFKNSQEMDRRVSMFQWDPWLLL